MVITMNYLYRLVKDYHAKDYSVFMNNLPSTDIQKIEKLASNNHKYECILSRIILKDMLKSNYNLDYNKLKIKYNTYGKPHIDNIYFNISHSHGYAIVATADNIIGVDIEKVRKIKLTTMKLFCTINEANYITNSSNPYLAFWSIYTLKEAYFKMLGKDLFNMKKVEFNITDNQIICKNNPNLKILLSTEIKDYVFSIIYKQ